MAFPSHVFCSIVHISMSSCLYFLFPSAESFFLRYILLILCLCNPLLSFYVSVCIFYIFIYIFSLFPTSFYRVFISFLSFCYFLFRSYFLIYLSLIFCFIFFILVFYPFRVSVTHAHCARVPVHSAQHSLQFAPQYCHGLNRSNLHT